MAEHSSDIYHSGLVPAAAGWEDRRASGAVAMRGPAHQSVIYYTVPAAVPGAGVTIPRHTPALVWQGTASASKAANSAVFDRTARRWLTFTVLLDGGHYVCPQDQWASVTGAAEVVGLEYVTRETVRRWDRRTVTGCDACGEDIAAMGRVSQLAGSFYSPMAVAWPVGGTGIRVGEYTTTGTGTVYDMAPSQHIIMESGGPDVAVVPQIDPVDPNKVVFSRFDLIAASGNPDRSAFHYLALGSGYGPTQVPPPQVGSNWGTRVLHIRTGAGISVPAYTYRLAPWLASDLTSPCEFLDVASHIAESGADGSGAGVVTAPNGDVYLAFTSNFQYTPGYTDGGVPYNTRAQVNILGTIPHGAVPGADGSIPLTVLASCSWYQDLFTGAFIYQTTWPGPFPHVERLGNLALDSSTGDLYLCVGAGAPFYEVPPPTTAVLRRDAGGVWHRFAGDGTRGFSGDGGPAISAQLAGPTGVCVDRHGTVYISDTLNHCVRRVDRVTGRITTVVGVGGTSGNTAPGQPPNRTLLYWPYGVAVDGNCNLLIADLGNARVLRVGC